MSILSKIEHWLLGRRYTPADPEEHAKFRAAVHEYRNRRMVTEHSVQKATQAADRAYDVAQIAITRLEEAKRIALVQGGESDG